MTKPQMKTEIAISTFSLEHYWIGFYATPDAASAFSEFGDLRRAEDTNYYSLGVDRRYDILDVVRYIQEYGK